MARKIDYWEQDECGNYVHYDPAKVGKRLDRKRRNIALVEGLAGVSVLGLLVTVAANNALAAVGLCLPCGSLSLGGLVLAIVLAFANRGAL